MSAADKIAAAPNRIRVGQDADGFWTCREAMSGSQEYVRADLADAQAQENARLRGLLWYAWHEFNAIRARDGAPRGSDTCCGRLGPTLVSEEWWNTLTEAFADAIGTDARTPWPSPEAKDVGETLKATP